MDIRQLRYFRELKEHGSLARAASELHITKQGLSKSVAALETELGCTLLLRGTNGVTVTRAGELLYEKAAAILDICDELERELASIEQAPRRIKIGASYGFFHTMPMHCVLGFFGNGTDIEPMFLPRTDYTLEKSVLAGDLDIGFCTNPIHLDELEYVHLFHNRRCLLCSADHPLAQKGELDVEDLKGVRMMSTSQKHYFDMNFFARKCREAGFEGDFQPVDDNSMLLHFPLNNKGVSLFVDSLYESENMEDLTRVFFRDPEFTYEANIIYRKDRKLSREERQLIRHLVEQCQELEKRRGKRRGE